MSRRNVTLSGEEVALITLAIQDEIRNTRVSAKVSGISLSENTERKIETLIDLTKRLNNW